MPVALGDFIWDAAESCWTGPAGFKAALKLMSNGARAAAVPGQPMGPAIFLCNSIPVEPGFEVLTNEDHRDGRPTRRDVDAWESITGYRPSGTTFAELLFDHLTVGADPAGLAAPKPLVPTDERRLILSLGGLLLVSRKFAYGSDPHTAKLTDLLKRDLSQCRTDSLEGRMRATTYRETARRVEEKYGVAFDAFRPSDWPANETPLRHGTVLTDNFNRADNDALGTASGGHTWTEVTGDFDIVSNTCQTTTVAAAGSGNVARAEQDVGTDQFSQILAQASEETALSHMSCMCRKDSSATLTFYCGTINALANTATVMEITADTVVTLESTPINIDATTNYTVMFRAQGSILSVYVDGIKQAETTDTSLSSEQRIGIRARKGTTGTVTIDDWEGGDLTGFKFWIFGPKT